MVSTSLSCVVRAASRAGEGGWLSSMDARHSAACMQVWQTGSKDMSGVWSSNSNIAGVHARSMLPGPPVQDLTCKMVGLKQLGKKQGGCVNVHHKGRYAR